MAKVRVSYVVRGWLIVDTEKGEVFEDHRALPFMDPHMCEVFPEKRDTEGFFGGDVFVTSPTGKEARKVVEAWREELDG